MKKRALSLLLALTMALSLLPATALAADLIQLETPTELAWGKDYDFYGNPCPDCPGMISWKANYPHQGQFIVNIYRKDKNELVDGVWLTSVRTEHASSDRFTYGNDMPSGTYYFTVQAKGDWVEYYDSEVATSDTFTYIQPTDRVGKPLELRWDWPRFEFAPPTNPANVVGYDGEVYFSATKDGEKTLVHSFQSICGANHVGSSVMDSGIQKYGEGYYWVRVRSLSGDITQWMNSEYTDFCEPYHLSTKDVNEALGSITATQPETIREEVQRIGADKLKDGMQADKGTQDGVISKMKALEEKAGGAAAIEVAPDAPAGFDQSGVSVVGARLNVPAGNDLKLKIGAPERDHVLPTLYNSTLAVKFSMDLDGVQDSENLKVPVQITLPVPEKINVNFLKILHYHAGQESPEEINAYTYQKDGKWFATFVLTSFSDFVMTVTNEGETPDPEEPKATALTKEMFTVDTEATVYTGSAVTKDISGKNGETTLVADTDYTVTYKNNINAGTATITITGKGDYTGTLTYEFKIMPKPIEIATVAVESKPYDGTSAAKVTNVTFKDGISLKPGEDYTVTAAFADANAATEAKKVTGTVTLKNSNYSLAVKEFETTATISKKDLSLAPSPLVLKTADYTGRVDLGTIPGLPRGETFEAFVLGTYTNVEVQLGEDKKTLTLTPAVGAADGGKGSVVATAESKNYMVTVTQSVVYTNKTPVKLSGITVADKTYDGKAIAYTGTLAATDPASQKSVAVDDAYVAYEWFAAATKLEAEPVNAGSYVLKVTVDTSKKAEPSPEPSPDSSPASDEGEAGKVEGQADEIVYFGVLEIPFTISKANLTVKADSKSVKVGGAVPQFTYTVTGLADKDKTEPWKTSPSAICAGADTSVKGSYDIVVSGGALKDAIAGNYAIKYVNATFKVTNSSGGSGWWGGGSSGGSSESDSSGGSSSSGSTTTATTDGYAVTVPTRADNGRVTFSGENAKAGDTVTLNVSPDRGYKLDKLTVKDKDGKVIALADGGNGKFTFTMPKSEVKVTATFAADEANPAEPITKRFNDIKESNWYRDAVQYVYDKGMMNGMSPKNFEPAASTSRAMLVTILYRLEGEPKTETASFSDVADWMYYAAPVAWAAENGIATGHEDGTFQPDGEITREQIVVLLYRYAKLKGYSVTKGEKNATFTDSMVIEPYAQEAVEWAASIGLVNGYQDGSFRPSGKAARAELAAILMRFCEGVAKTKE